MQNESELEELARVEGIGITYVENYDSEKDIYRVFEILPHGKPDFHIRYEGKNSLEAMLEFIRCCLNIVSDLSIDKTS